MNICSPYDPVKHNLIFFIISVFLFNRSINYDITTIHPQDLYTFAISELRAKMYIIYVYQLLLDVSHKDFNDICIFYVFLKFLNFYSFCR